MPECAVQTLARELDAVGLTIKGLLDVVQHAYKDARRDRDPPWEDLTDQEKGFLMGSAHQHTSTPPGDLWLPQTNGYESPPPGPSSRPSPNTSGNNGTEPTPLVDAL